jgi:phosphoribosyl 1,2-cyclic phosphodiesterase
MQVVVLASGSKGNVTYIENEGTRILIDIGKSCSYIEKELNEIGVDPKTIDAVLITHTHTDHTKGLKTFYKKYKPVIYVMPKMMIALTELLEEFKYHYFDDETTIGSFNVKIIKTSHDSLDSVGFLINDSIVYITDTGYINERYIETLQNKIIYIMESNHDIEMLYNGSYPYHLKKRIASDMGHLSNEAASLYLSKLVGNKTKHIVLAHLSEENNTKEIAFETLQKSISKKDIDITIAKQDERTQVIEV